MKKFAILFVISLLFISANNYAQMQNNLGQSFPVVPHVSVLNPDASGQPPHVVEVGQTYTVVYTGAFFDNTTNFEFDAFGLNGMSLSTPGGSSTTLTWQAPNIEGQYNLVIRVIGVYENTEYVADLPITITVKLPEPVLND